MTLDEIEKLARDIAALNASDKPGEGHVATDLARALLALLPVMRAAEEWRDSKHAGRRSWLVPTDDSDLVSAIDTARREREGM